MKAPLILISNPGTASRKYALYAGRTPRGELHFEYQWGKVVCTAHTHGQQHVLRTNVTDLRTAGAHIADTLREQGLLAHNERIEIIGIRIVAPSSFFLQDHDIDDEVVQRLHVLLHRAPLHIRTLLEEYRNLHSRFPEARIVGISDSAFHATKPDAAWNYGIPLEDADRFEIKRFGYHGLSVASAVHELHGVEKLPQKLVVVHLGGGASVTAVHAGRSWDTTMGYSPLEGVVMTTRSGSIDPTAVCALKDVFHLNDDAVEEYLNNHSGLLGLGGSADIRELLRRESDGDHVSQLALATYVLSVQKGIGQMIAALGGADVLAFTGAVGERSAPIRQRIIARLGYMDFFADAHTNAECVLPQEVTCISQLAHSRPIFVVPAREAAEMARHLL